jgi:hypothetical protein
MLLIFGDSNVAGWRPDMPKLFKKSQTWPYHLQQLLDAPVRIDGQPGRAL